MKKQLNIKSTCHVWQCNVTTNSVVTIHYVRYLQEEEDLPTGRKYSLIIKSVQQEDYGSYNCTVKNDYGSHAMAIVFEKKGECNQLRRIDPW